MTSSFLFFLFLLCLVSFFDKWWLAWDFVCIFRKHFLYFLFQYHPHIMKSIMITLWISSVMGFGGSFGSSIPWSCSLQLLQSQDSFHFFLFIISNSPCIMPGYSLLCQVMHLPSQLIALSSSSKVFPCVPHLSLLLFTFSEGISDPSLYSKWEWVFCMMPLTSMVGCITFMYLLPARFVAYL